MSHVLEVSNISKKFGKKTVLDEVSFCLDKGQILGFIGPNGAGKTTAIKLILGLQLFKSGKIIINGYDLKKDFENAVSRVGAIVENPDVYMYLTGRENLELVARLYPDVSSDRIEELINLSGLGKRIDDKVSKYSLGMRQRLGIVMSLVNSPNILILDEPTNGLDPQGIKDLRRIILDLANKYEVAVLISSHNLSELESFITHACIIQDGRIVDYAPVEKLKSVSESAYIFEVDDVVKSLDVVDNSVKVDESRIKVYVDASEISNVLRLMLDNDIIISGFYKYYQTLEDAFLRETGVDVND